MQRHEGPENYQINGIWAVISFDFNISISFALLIEIINIWLRLGTYAFMKLIYLPN
jgi:hypothetical protein